MSSVVIIGITSALGGELLRVIPSSIPIIGLVRPIQTNKLSEFKSTYRTSITEYKNVKLIDYNGKDDDLQDKLKKVISDSNPSKVVYLSTHVSVLILQFLRESNVSTLTIGSGAVVDWGMGRDGVSIVNLAQNDNTREFGRYIEGKALAERVSNVTIHPGFYLPGEGPMTWSGLHLESARTIFGETFDESFKWGKDKFVTPMSALSELLFKWIVQPNYSNSGGCGTPSGGYGYGSNSAFPRWKLRELAGFDDVPQHIKDKYPFNQDECYNYEMSRTCNDFSMDKFDVEHACKKSRMWIETHEKEIEQYIDLIKKD